jgi:tetratricopeptide (TPR) repeat protein
LARQYAEEELRSWQSRYAMHLVQQKKYEQAATVLQPHDPPTATELEVRYRIALANNQFDSLVEQYRAAPDKAPQPELLRTVASSLQKSGEPAAARKLLEFVFTQEIASHQLTASNMLGLAEIRLQDGDIAGAMDLLHRLVLVVGQPFENFDSAAMLLSRNGRHAQAVEFLTRLVKATPWDNTARLHLAQEQIAAGQNVPEARRLATAVASDSDARYADRLAAAAVLSGTGPTLGSGELDYVAYGVGTPDRPYFYTARLNAAKKTDADIAAGLLANALADSPHQDSARVPLVNLLAKLKRDRLAIAAVQPLLQRGYLPGMYGMYSGYRDQASDIATGTEDASEPPTEPSPAESPTTPGRPEKLDAERVAVAVTVADSYRNIGELETALRYYRAALGLQASAPQRTEINRKISSVRVSIRRNANNDLRMPVIHNELEQPHTVRPRLVAAARTSPPATPVRTKGGAQ